MSGVHGIQENTFMRESAIQNAKKYMKNIFITWMDLANALAFSSFSNYLIRSQFL